MQDLVLHDPRPRALGIQRFLVPLATPGIKDMVPRTVPEIADAIGRQAVRSSMARPSRGIENAQLGGVIAKLKKDDVARTEPITVSLMPPGLDMALASLRSNEIARSQSPDGL